jgi:hypothetical protein
MQARMLEYRKAGNRRPVIAKRIGVPELLCLRHRVKSSSTADGILLFRRDLNALANESELHGLVEQRDRVQSSRIRRAGPEVRFKETRIETSQPGGNVLRDFPERGFRGTLEMICCSLGVFRIADNSGVNDRVSTLQLSLHQRSTMRRRLTSLTEIRRQMSREPLE